MVIRMFSQCICALFMVTLGGFVNTLLNCTKDQTLNGTSILACNVLLLVVCTNVALFWSTYTKMYCFG